MRRPLSKDAAYARELGLVGTHISRTIQRLGGAAKLRALDPETRGVLLKPFYPGPSAALHKGGLAARGMGQRRTKPSNTA